MARIAKTIDDDHFYIRPGQGTRQIKPAGVNWLRKSGQKMPSAGQNVSLHYGTYRFLEDHNYLYIDNIDYEKRIAHYFIPSSREIEEDGPSLLLKVNTSSAKTGSIKTSWTLKIKIDEINAAGREVLIKKEDVAIGCDFSDPSSMLELRFVGDPHRWPSIKPRSTNYPFYYKSWEGGIFPLKEAIPTSGLLDNWQGNVFRACEQSGLEQYWRRLRTNNSITLRNNQVLYWLAKTGNQPEWPGSEKTIGQPQDGWQLWHLQMNGVDLSQGNSLIEFERWFRYRGIRLNYPGWRIYMINPLYSSTEVYRYHVQPGQPLLFGCIPPTTPSGNASLTIRSSPQQQFGHARIVRQPISAPLDYGMTNYFRFHVPFDQQEYLFNVSGVVASRSLRIKVAPPLSKLPNWLDGFQCCLKMADKRYYLNAFANEPSQIDEWSLFQVSEHFTLEELAMLTVDCSPVELPCSGRVEYPSPQGEDCYENVFFDTTAGNFTTWWQNIIWDKVRDCSWLKLMLDAGSFGRIRVKFHLKSEVLDESGEVSQLAPWWINEEIVTELLWLSHSAQSGSKGICYPLSPTIQITLKQLCKPAMPTYLAAALLRLSSYKTMPGWASVRLRTLLAKISLKEPISH